jgi:hypothetical protein
MITSVKLKNFMPFYGEHEITLPEGIIHIRGKYSNNEDLSNRSGKSSFLTALYYGLFGGKNSHLISDGEDSMAVELCLDNSLILRRENGSAFLNGTRSTHSILDAVSVEYLKMSPMEFLYTLGAFQDNVYGFLSASPKSQKEFLLNYAENHYDWDSMHSKLKDILNVLGDRIKLYESKINMLEEELSKVKLVSTKELLRTSWTTLKNYRHELQQSSEEEAKRMASAQLLKNKIDSLKELLQNNIRLEATKMQIIQKKARYKEELAKIELQRQQYPSLSTLHTKINLLNERRITLEVQHKYFQERLIAYTTSKGMCPILGKDCPLKEDLDVSAKEWVKTMSSINSDLTETVRELDTLIAQKDIVIGLEKEWNKYNTELLTLKIPEFRDIGELKEEIRQEEEKYNLISNETADAFRKELFAKEARLSSLCNTLKSTLVQRAKFALEKRLMESRLERIRERQKSVMVATKLVSPHGIPYVHLMNVLEKLESYTNKFLEKAGMKIQIVPFKELASLEDMCLVDGRKFARDETVCPVCGSARQKKIQEQIEVITADRQIKWQEESGGGKTIIALGLRLGIFKLLKEYKQVRGDFLIVDEAFSFLDTTNSELVLNMLVDSFSELGLKQMFIVSHNELKDMLPVTLWINYDQEKQKAFIEQA